ncbi:MAG: hypothetical protein JWQ65_2815, partial [Devosia sp.]|nr:hypothetical protein [Devosia sp.]
MAALFLTKPALTTSALECPPLQSRLKLRMALAMCHLVGMNCPSGLLVPSPGPVLPPAYPDDLPDERLALVRLFCLDAAAARIFGEPHPLYGRPGAQDGTEMQIDLNSYKTILVVSPHLDDGVLSVGGLIEKAAANGADVIVATAFTADTPPGMAISPLAIELHALWNLGSNPFEHRRNEDIAAVGALGARTLHGPLLDALYRTDRDGNFLYPTRQSIFSQPPEHDDVGEALSHLLDQWIADLSPDLVLTPLGVGRHADHIQTTNALRRLA